MTIVCSESPDLVGDALEEALPVAEALSGQADSLASALGNHPPNPLIHKHLEKHYMLAGFHLSSV
jgi:hypothetical protein